MTSPQLAAMLHQAVAVQEEGKRRCRRTARDRMHPAIVDPLLPLPFLHVQRPGPFKQYMGHHWIELIGFAHIDASRYGMTCSTHYLGQCCSPPQALVCDRNTFEFVCPICQGAEQCSGGQRSVLHGNAVQHKGVWGTAMRHREVRGNATQVRAARGNAVQGNGVQGYAVWGNAPHYRTGACGGLFWLKRKLAKKSSSFVLVFAEETLCLVTEHPANALPCTALPWAVVPCTVLHGPPFHCPALTCPALH